MPSSIVVPKTKRCAFCDYLMGRRPYTILRKLDLVAILVTREQRGRAHVLVMPTEHRETILDLKPNEATAVMSSVIDAARVIDQVERAAGISVWQSNGTNANQKIPHVHFHVAGTLDGGGTEWGPVDEVSIPETEAIANKLYKRLRNSLISP